MRRILFVDDDQRALESLHGIFRPLRKQWEMAFAAGGESALAILATSPFDVIVSDVRMPVMDGVTLLAQVRERYPHIVRIALSGQADNDLALRAVRVAHQFLAKPCDPPSLRVAVERACHLRGLLGDRSIRRLVGGMGELPSVPRVCEALVCSLENDDVALAEIAKIVEQDVAISAKILQIVNSAFYGLAQSITTIKSAVSYLGINTLRNLALSLVIFRAFKPDRYLAGFSLEPLQKHAQLTARIAAHLPAPKYMADIAVLAGMLHDIGKLILACKLPDQFARVLEASRTARRPVHVVEAEKMGASHAEIGAYLLGLWGLPFPILEAVAYHHSPNRLPQQKFDADAAVYVANCLAHEREVKLLPGPHHVCWPIDMEYLGLLGVEDQLPGWRDMAAELCTSSPRKTDDGRVSGPL